jgi:hypothetical protein
MKYSRQLIIGLLVAAVLCALGNLYFQQKQSELDDTFNAIIRKGDNSVVPVGMSQDEYLDQLTADYNRASAYGLACIGVGLLAAGGCGVIYMQSRKRGKHSHPTSAAV